MTWENFRNSNTKSIRTVGWDWRYVESINVCHLQLNRVHPLLFICPLHVAKVPNILDDPKQNCMEDLDWRILCRVKPWWVCQWTFWGRTKTNTFHIENLVSDYGNFFIYPMQEFGLNLGWTHMVILELLCSQQELIDPKLCVCVLDTSCRLFLRNTCFDPQACKLQFLFQASSNFLWASQCPQLSCSVRLTPHADGTRMDWKEALVPFVSLFLNHCTTDIASPTKMVSLSPNMPGYLACHWVIRGIWVQLEANPCFSACAHIIHSHWFFVCLSSLL